MADMYVQTGSFFPQLGMYLPGVIVIVIVVVHVCCTLALRERLKVLNDALERESEHTLETAALVAVLRRTWDHIADATDVLNAMLGFPAMSSLLCCLCNIICCAFYTLKWKILSQFSWIAMLNDFSLVQWGLTFTAMAVAMTACAQRFSDEARRTAILVQKMLLPPPTSPPQFLSWFTSGRVSGTVSAPTTFSSAYSSTKSLHNRAVIGAISDRTGIDSSAGAVNATWSVSHRDFDGGSVLNPHTTMAHNTTTPKGPNEEFSKFVSTVPNSTVTSLNNTTIPSNAIPNAMLNKTETITVASALNPISVAPLPVPLSPTDPSRTFTFTLESQLRDFASQLSSRPLEISGAGFITVDLTTLTGLMATVVTYLFLSIQFEESENTSDSAGIVRNSVE